MSSEAAVISTAVFGGDDHTLDVIQRMRPLVSVMRAGSEELRKQVYDLDEDVAPRLGAPLSSIMTDLLNLEREMDAIADGIDFYALSDFSLVICKPDRRVIYSGCNWNAIAEEGKLGTMVAEKVSVVAKKRMEVVA